MKKPKSLWRFVQEGEERRLLQEAKNAKPRTYFRASEMGSCSRKIALSMLGSEPRPMSVKTRLVLDMGEASHVAMQKLYNQHVILDGQEGAFDDPSMFNALSQRTPESVRTLRLVKKDEDYLHHDVHVICTHKSHDLEVHFRPDGIIRGLRHPKEGPVDWEPDDWELFEYKSTTDYGVSAARASALEPTRPWGWYPAFVTQCQIQMHFLGLRQARIVQSGRDHPEPISDEYQAEQSRVWSSGKNWKFPEHQWTAIPYDEQMALDLLDRMVMIKEHLGAGTLPDHECPGPGVKSFIYNSCEHNAEGDAHTSAAKCRGLQSASESSI